MSSLRYLLSLPCALWDGLGLGTVPLPSIVFGHGFGHDLGLESSDLVNVTGNYSPISSKARFPELATGVWNELLSFKNAVDSIIIRLFDKLEILQAILS